MNINVIASLVGCVLTMILGKFVLAELRKLKQTKVISQRDRERIEKRLREKDRGDD